MKKLTVKISKQTGFKYLEASKVKKTIDTLMDRIEELEKRVEELETECS